MGATYQNNEAVVPIALEHATKRFKTANGGEVTAADAVDLAVAEGEWLALAGPSGSGKTTVLRLVAGLEQPTSGVVRIGDRKVNEVPARERNVGMVFQSHALYPHMTAEENIAFGLKVRGLPRPEIRRRVGELADLLGITECLQRTPGELSGGQARRIAIARALARQPAILLMDEPLSDLDGPLKRRLLAELTALRGRLQTTCLYVTHDQAEAMVVGDRLAIMVAGRILQAAQPQDVYATPATLEVARFIGEPPMNFFPGTMKTEGDELRFFESGQGVETPLRFRLPATSARALRGYAGTTILLGLRPECLELRTPVLEVPGPTSEDQVSAGTCSVTSVQHLGSETHVFLDRQSTLVSVRQRGASDLKPRQVLQLWLDPARAHYFNPNTGLRLSSSPWRAFSPGV